MRRIVIATRDAQTAAGVARAVEDVATAVRCEPDAASVQDAVRRVEPDLLILDVDVALGAGAEMEAALRGALEARPGLRHVAVGDDGDAATVLAAVRAGAADFVGRDASPDEVARQVGLALRACGRPERAEAGAMALVFSGRPNDGESQFAINLAAWLSVRDKARGETLLIDCALPATEADSALDLDLTYLLRDAVGDMARMDRTLLTSTLPRHKASGLFVLPLSIAAEPVRDVPANSLLALGGLVRGMFANTVVNLGGFRHSALLGQFCAAATATYLCAVQSFPSVKACHGVLRQAGLGERDRARTLLVICDHQAEIGLTEKQMAATLELARTARLPAARADLLNGLNNGEPLAVRQPRSAYAQALARAVELSAGAHAPAGPAARRGLLRLAPRFG